MPSEICILTQEDISARILRLAYELYESHFTLEKFHFVGVDHRGSLLAAHLCNALEAISGRPTELSYLPRLDADVTLTHEELNAPKEATQPLFLVDDVLYTGRTLFTAMVWASRRNPAFIRSVVLIDRGHRSLPVAADYVGLELATTLQEYVFVRYDSHSNQFSAFLS